jgi:hypothetical protein
MFVLIDKKKQSVIVSCSNKEISEKTGIKYTTLSYYAKKKYYENLNVIFAKVEPLKSKQGGLRSGNKLVKK